MNKKIKILRTDKKLYIIENKLETIKNKIEVVTVDREEDLIKQSEDADIILTCYDKVSAKVINSAKRLKGIVKYGVGTDNIDIDAATKKRIMVVNCPDYGSDTVADHAFALLISLARKLIKIDDVMKSKAWEWPKPEYLGIDLSGKTIGLIGFGRIGRAMARRCKGFGMKMLAYDPYIKQEEAISFDVKLVELDQLLENSDFISIHCVLTPETKEMIGEKEFNKMKKTVLLINTARGAIIKKDALIDSLNNKKIFGAGMDVFEEEPLSLDYPLLNMNNVILTPHLAWYTKEAFERVGEDTFQGILDIINGRIPKHLKNKEVLKKL